MQRREHAIDRQTLTAFRRSVRVLERDVLRQLGSQTVCGTNVTLPQCHVLVELSLCGQTTLGALASALALDKSTVSRTVESLVKSGLLERRTDPKDRRATRLGLTSAGGDRARFINEHCDRYYAEILGRLSKIERRRVIDAVTVFADLIEKSHVRAGGRRSCPVKTDLLRAPDRRTRTGGSRTKRGGRR